MITPPLMLGRNEPTPCAGCPYFTGPGCGCDGEGHLWPQRPDYAGAVLAFLGPTLAALLTDDDHRRQLLDIRDLIDDDDLARAWLVGMNPMLYDESPISAIADGHGEAALIAARDFA